MNLKSAGGKIGIFDSGFGGLSILKYIVEELSEYDYLYFGDTARNPYGTRSQEIIYEFTIQSLEKMFELGSEIVILACNTASAEALRKIQKEFLPEKFPNKKVLGVIIPTAEEVSAVGSQKIGIMATEATVRSGAFSMEIKKLIKNDNLKIIEISCPLLVPLVENGEADSQVARLALGGYLKPLLHENIDTIILGCTHYGFFKNHLEKILPNSIRIIEEGPIVARKLKDYLLRHVEIDSNLSKKNTIDFYTTDDTDSFNEKGAKFFGKKINSIHVH